MKEKVHKGRRAPKVETHEEAQAHKTSLRKPVWQAKGLYSSFQILMPPAKILKAWIIKMPANLRTLSGKQCLAAWIEKEPGSRYRALFRIQEYQKPIFNMDIALELFPDFFTPEELKQLANIPACELDSWPPGGELE